MSRVFRLPFILLFSIAVNAPALLAQVDRAVLEGTVKDTSGAVIAGATVKILAVATGITEEQHTNSAGYYRVPGLPIGHYTVTVSNDNFKTKVIEGVPLEVGQTHTLDIALEVGSISEKVDVMASGDPAERSSAESSAVIGEVQIENLPLNGRNWA